MSKKTSNIKINSLRMEGIYKKFPRLIANNNINIEIQSGEILGLLGENGAGKSTLMKILYGIYKPTKGRILINDKEVHIKSPKDAIKNGIGMVHQHFMLVESHSVAENLALGYEELPFFSPLKYLKRKVEKFFNEYGLKVDLNSKIWQLSAGERQKVEILKALLKGASLLILDEPTSVLTQEETKKLFNILRKMKKDGHCVIFITHKLEEVLAITDNVTILRKGEKIATLKTTKTNKKELAKLMVGREVLFHIERKDVNLGDTILEIENLNIKNDKDLECVKNISFKIREGEIFGIAGVSGNGQRELVEALTGLRKVESGKIFIKGKEVTNLNIKEYYRKGLAHIPEERFKYPIVPNFSLKDNTLLKKQDREEFLKYKFFLKYDKIEEYTKKIIENFNVSTSGLNIPIKNLSGGNIQKFILGREILDNPHIIIASHPTYGLDIGAIEFIRKLLLSMKEQGKGILLVSEDLDEILELSDTIGVMYEGKFMDIIPRNKAKKEEIGLMMAGITKDNL